MKRSESINEIASALSKAQGSMGILKKNKNVKVKFKSGSGYDHQYADLAEIIDCIKKPFSDNGLSYIQTLEPKEKVVNLVTTLMHSSGQWIESIYELPLIGGDVSDQNFGASLTYGRRYSLQSLAGVEADQDIDGPLQNGELDKDVDGNNKEQSKPKNELLISMSDVSLFYEKSLDNWGLKKEDVDHRLFDSYGVASAKELKKFQFNELMEKMNKKR